MNKNQIFFSVSLFILVSFLAYMLVISVPNNPISMRYSFFKNTKLNALLPEGWAFFTKNPREDQIFIYTINGEKVSEISLKNSDANQFFGVKRENRFLQDKIGKVVSGIEEKYWYSTNQSVTDVNILDSANVLAMDIKKPAICGRHLIELRKAIPWSYFRSPLRDNIKMDRKYVVINFKCEE